MPITMRDYVYHLSSGTIAGIIGNTRYDAIDEAFGKVIEAMENRGIADSYSWSMESVWNLFKEVA